MGLGKLWFELTDFGDAAVLLPAAVAVLLVLGVARAWWTAAAWGLALIACLLATTLLKLGFSTCGERVADGLITSPSGHAALSTMVYGGVAALVAMGARRPWVGLLAGAAAAAWVVAIAVSRVIVDAHTVPEVLVGLAVGVASVAGFAALARAGPVPTPPLLVRLAVTVAALIVLLHGDHATAEDLIVQAADLLRSHLGDVCG